MQIRSGTAHTEPTAGPRGTLSLDPRDRPAVADVVQERAFRRGERRPPIERDAERRVRRNARTGLIQIGLLAAACVLIFFLDEIRRQTEEGPRMTLVADAAPGLEPGSSVWVAGRPVGRVLSVRLRTPEAGRAEHIVVRAVLHRSVEGVIREDARATIRPSDLLEPMVVSLDPGSPGRPPFDFADTLPAVEERIDQERVMALADTLRNARRNLEERIESVQRALGEGRGTLGRLRADPELAAGLSARMRSAAGLVERLETGTLGRLARDSALAERAARIRESLRALSRPDAGEEEAAEGLRETLAHLDSLGDRIGRLSAALERGEGTAGRALADRELSRQLALLRARLDTVVTELARSPDRWLRVRIF